MISAWQYFPVILIFALISLATTRLKTAHFTGAQRFVLATVVVYLAALDLLCFTPSQISWAALNDLQPTWLLGRVPANFIPFYKIDLGFFLNILMTIPLGIYLSLLVKQPSLALSLKAGLICGVTIESSQLLFGAFFDIKRWVDINDVITNCLGVILGYGAYLAITKLSPKLVRNFQL
ncbi:MAG: VanZ family protein [Lactobacillus sp.]|jgi:glycopeptide antibiotics resistance protein|nr:VanZ family protein [Lactobacillus sp.]